MYCIQSFLKSWQICHYNQEEQRGAWERYKWSMADSSSKQVQHTGNRYGNLSSFYHIIGNCWLYNSGHLNKYCFFHITGGDKSGRLETWRLGDRRARRKRAEWNHVQWKQPKEWSSKAQLACEKWGKEGRVILYAIRKVMPWKHSSKVNTGWIQCFSLWDEITIFGWGLIFQLPY